MPTNPSPPAFDLLSLPEKRAAAIDLICESHGGELYFTNRMGERL